MAEVPQVTMFIETDVATKDVKNIFGATTKVVDGINTYWTPNGLVYDTVSTSNSVHLVLNKLHIFNKIQIYFVPKTTLLGGTQIFPVSIAVKDKNNNNVLDTNWIDWNYRYNLTPVTFSVSGPDYKVTTTVGILTVYNPVTTFNLDEMFVYIQDNIANITEIVFSYVQNIPLGVISIDKKRDFDKNLKSTEVITSLADETFQYLQFNSGKIPIKSYVIMEAQYKDYNDLIGHYFVTGTETNVNERVYKIFMEDVFSLFETIQNNKNTPVSELDSANMILERILSQGNMHGDLIVRNDLGIASYYPEYQDIRTELENFVSSLGDIFVYVDKNGNFNIYIRNAFIPKIFAQDRKFGLSRKTPDVSFNDTNQSVRMSSTVYHDIDSFLYSQSGTPFNDGIFSADSKYFGFTGIAGNLGGFGPSTVGIALAIGQQIKLISKGFSKAFINYSGFTGAYQCGLFQFSTHPNVTNNIDVTMDVYDSHHNLIHSETLNYTGTTFTVLYDIAYNVVNFQTHIRRSVTVNAVESHTITDISNPSNTDPNLVVTFTLTSNVTYSKIKDMYVYNVWNTWAYWEFLIPDLVQYSSLDFALSDISQYLKIYSTSSPDGFTWEPFKQVLAGKIQSTPQVYTLILLMGLHENPATIYYATVFNPLKIIYTIANNLVVPIQNIMVKELNYREGIKYYNNNILFNEILVNVRNVIKTANQGVASIGQFSLNIGETKTFSPIYSEPVDKATSVMDISINSVHHTVNFGAHTVAGVYISFTSYVLGADLLITNNNISPVTIDSLTINSTEYVQGSQSALEYKDTTSITTFGVINKQITNRNIDNQVLASNLATKYLRGSQSNIVLPDTVVTDLDLNIDLDKNVNVVDVFNNKAIKSELLSVTHIIDLYSNNFETSIRSKVYDWTDYNIVAGNSVRLFSSYDDFVNNASLRELGFVIIDGEQVLMAKKSSSEPVGVIILNITYVVSTIPNILEQMSYATFDSTSVENDIAEAVLNDGTTQIVTKQNNQTIIIG